MAHVMLVPPRNPTDRSPRPSLIKTTFDGRFEFGALAPGRYRVFVSKSGYLPLMDGGRVTNAIAGPSITLGAGEVYDHLEIALTRFGTMTGRVLDEYGAPVMGARVQALRVRYQGGRRKLVAADLPDRSTDDFGSFRLYGLTAGAYIVSAFIGDVSSADVSGYARTYFPGVAASTDAQFVSVDPGQDVVGLDVPLARVPTARIAGRWIDSQGQPGGGALTLMPAWRTSAAPAEATGARIGRDGTFEFRNVPPGDYVIHASRGRLNPWTEGEFGTLPIAVSGQDVNDLVLQTSAGSYLGGQISFDTLDRTKTPTPSALEIVAMPVDADRSPTGGWASARILPDWRFEMRGLSGPRRLVVNRLPAGWMLQEVRVGGADATDRPLDFGRVDQSLANVEITLTDRVSELSGGVSDENNRPIADAHVVVFAADRDRWFEGSRFVRDAISSAQGGYSIAGLPFGSYYVTTVPPVMAEGSESWQDPTFLTTLISRAAPVTISEGQRVSRAIRVTSR
jgi:hypothetical protein